MRRIAVLTVLAALALPAVVGAVKVGETYYVQPQTLQMRLFPKNTAPTAGTLVQGEKVDVQEIKDLWAKVAPQSGARAGWVLARFLSSEKIEKEHQRAGVTGSLSDISDRQFMATAGSRAIGNLGTTMRNAGMVTQADTDAVDRITEFKPDADLIERLQREGKLGQYQEVQ